MDWQAYYPRPQMKRERFLSLNGLWQLNGQDICIPFPPESRLSGFCGEIMEEMVYSRSFELPEGFLPENHRLFIHFGAVDQTAKVDLNDHHVVSHEGGYLPFSADITDALRPGENDPTCIRSASAP